ncbi:hypothetical protein D3C87_1332090 [compost metagenome]
MLELLFVMLMSDSSHAQSKGKLNTSLYEAEEGAEKSFTAKVRVVRDISDEVEVFFDSPKATGAYTLPRSAAGYAQMLKDLEASKKPKGPAVSITADEDKRIKTVQINKSAEPERDPNKTWDFGPLKGE